MGDVGSENAFWMDSTLGGQEELDTDACLLPATISTGTRHRLIQFPGGNFTGNKQPEERRVTEESVMCF